MYFSSLGDCGDIRIFRKKNPLIQKKSKSVIFQIIYLAFVKKKCLSELRPGFVPRRDHPQKCHLRIVNMGQVSVSTGLKFTFTEVLLIVEF